MGEPEHVAERPSWRCRVDGEPWPCEPAKAALLREYKGFRVSLLLYLAACMAEAREDLAEQDSGHAPANLTERFVSWATVAAE